ncbi:MAG: hypothetical protein JXQ83_08025 [Candidatus Glassbacteria bacterium]|nr:hypothetical protein [Candidatus Glassbacteria bacterium]
MHKCPSCGNMTLNFKYECGVAVARCTKCDYLKASWPYYEQAIKKLREVRKTKTCSSPLINLV